MEKFWFLKLYIRNVSKTVESSKIILVFKRARNFVRNVFSDYLSAANIFCSVMDCVQ